MEHFTTALMRNGIKTNRNQCKEPAKHVHIDDVTNKRYYCSFISECYINLYLREPMINSVLFSLYSILQLLISLLLKYDI